MSIPGTAHSAETPQLERLNVGYSAQAVSVAPLWVAQDSGAFRKHGIETRQIFLAGGLAPAAILAGEVQFSTMSSGVGLAPALKGADIVFIAALSNYISHALLVAPEITDGKQLKGKRIAIQRFGDLTHVSGREAVKHLGLTEADVALLQIGGNPTRFAALQSGTAQGAVLTPPYISRAQKLSYRVLVNLIDLRIPFAGTAIATTRRTIATRRPMVLNFLRGLSEGIHIYKRQRAAAVAIIEKRLRGVPLTELNEAIDHYTRDLDDRPYPRAEGLKIALDQLLQQSPEIQGVTPEKFLDAGPLRELEKDGFFTALQSSAK